MRRVRGWQPARLAAMLMTYTGRLALATRISKDLSMPLSRLLPPIGQPLSDRAGGRAACRNPLFAAGSPRPRTPRPAPRRAGALGRPALPPLYASSPMRFGLDFGTSNTSLAVNDGTSTRVLPIDAVAGETMPTILYIRRDGTPIVGRAAIDAYLEDNRTRGPLTREVQLLGIRLPSTDPTHKSLEAYILADTSAPGRPVRFIGGDDAEARATGRLRAAAELAGFRDVHFVAEPIAAAHAADVGPGTSLVFDFGGGTLDLCVVRRDAGGLGVLATAGGPIGGDRATELLIEDGVAPRLGSRAEWGPKRLRLPRYIVNALRDWHALSALNEKPLLDALDDLVRAGAPRRTRTHEVVERIEERLLVQRGEGVPIAERVHDVSRKPKTLRSPLGPRAQTRRHPILDQ